MSELFANVAFNLPLDNLFTYKIPPHLISSAIPGKRVLAGFGNKKITGIIVNVTDITEHKKLRSILDLLDENVIIEDELMEFCKWLSEYYCAPIGEVIFSAIPGKMNISTDKFYKLHEEYLKQLDNSELKEDIFLKIIEALENKEFAAKKQLERKLNFNDLSSYLKTLEEKKIIYSENQFSKTVSEKRIKTASLNFSLKEIDKIISQHKIRSEKQIEFMKLLSEDRFNSI